MGNYRKYREVIHNYRHDYDYDYLLRLIELKLKRMSNYFWHSDIAMDSKLYAQQINRLLSLMRIVREEGGDILPYVNTRNWKRFVWIEPSKDKEERNCILSTTDGKEMNLGKSKSRWYYDRLDLRYAKAWHLLWRGMEVYTRHFWD